ncbi:hypothetical protein SAMN02745111_02037 [Eubacterium uniforme]|uniref:Uncharacterized protein n=1 Tax=Eubacterium uniforme TaxID=39495 RepID=A0A1T4VZK9_9FIRM|nr:hypothetical protein [Eubacterium uniforme]SKA70450.1 hypothetical protein SAMN02745111_02037 [Eubacterium uniforme]
MESTGNPYADGKDEQIIDPYGKATIADIEYAFAQLIEVCVNTVVEDKSSKATYKVTSNKGKLTVTYNSSKNKNASKAVIPDLVKIKGKKYKVT